jgi:catechol 2,3-dioxygenase-like lactoylglutathione lyase family enzyme
MQPAKEAIDVGIVARGADELVAFYRDALGLDYVEAFATRVGPIHRLRFGDSWLKILEGSSSGPVVRHGFGEAGIHYLTFEISDIDAVWARLAEAGAPVVMPLREDPRTGTTAGSVCDPEGNIVELLARRTAAVVN